MTDQAKEDIQEMTNALTDQKTIQQLSYRNRHVGFSMPTQRKWQVWWGM